MKLNLVIFYKISNHYLYLTNDIITNGINSTNYKLVLLIHENLLNKYKTGNYILGDELKILLNDKNLNYAYNYICYNEEKIIVFLEYKPKFKLDFSIFQNRKDSKLQIERSKYYVANFRYKSRDNLAISLLQENATLETSIKAFMVYTLSDIYTLWVYNPHTDVCTNELCSLGYYRSYITRKSGTSIFDFIDSKDANISREPKHNLDREGFFKDMNTVNRLLLNLGEDGTKGILSFYSKYKGFEQLESTKKHIQQYLQDKYFSLVAKRHSELDRVQSIFYDQDYTGRIQLLYNKLTKSICDELYFQACSIFLKKNNSNSLVLVNSYNNEYHGVPIDEVIYPLDRDTLTTDVYKSGAVGFSYNIEEDELNSHIYDEPTKDLAQNWIGLPIFADNNVVGVLRVKNKFRKNIDNQFEVIPFRSTDIRRLSAITNNLSAISYIEYLYTKALENQNDLKSKYNDLQEFNELFLHELRTPISLFLLSPGLIRKVIDNNIKDKNKNCRPLRLLDDLLCLGQRLKLIVNIHNIDELIKETKKENIYIIKDIVKPILNVIEYDLKRKYNQKVKIISTNLESTKVYVDKKLAGIAFNALIDNAAKYSRDSDKPIIVEGQIHSSGLYLLLVVKNYGIEISENEIEAIFKRNFRGQQAKEVALAGTGIGLYVARKIMNVLDGDVILLKRYDPVEICLKLKLSEFRRTN